LQLHNKTVLETALGQGLQIERVPLEVSGQFRVDLLGHPIGLAADDVLGLERVHGCLSLREGCEEDNAVTLLPLGSPVMVQEDFSFGTFQSLESLHA